MGKLFLIPLFYTFEKIWKFYFDLFIFLLNKENLICIIYKPHEGQIPKGNLDEPSNFMFD